VLALVVSSGTQAANGVPDGLDVGSMALSPSDFDGGALVAREGFVASNPPVAATYERVFRTGARLAGARLLMALSEVLVFSDDREAASAFEGMRELLSTSRGRGAFAKGILGGVKGVSVRVARPVTLPLGQGAFRLSIVGRVRTALGPIRLDFAITALRVDRAIGVVALSGVPGARLTARPAQAAATKLARRFGLGFTIRSVAPPTVRGIVQQGQTLTVDPGRWSGAPSQFAYQWNRCDAAGSSCTPIPGATAQTYLLGPPDSTKRIGVTVKAANSVSSASVMSSMTPGVP
jgi:hypothetical protein